MASVVAMKRPLDDGVDSSHPSKLSKSELYRPPTNEELNHLRETENLYQSSLFRMQIKELLGEVMIKDKRTAEIAGCVEALTKVLRNLPKGKEYELMDQAWCSDVKVPLDQTGPPLKGVYHFHPPRDVRVIGSYHHGTLLKPCQVDLVVQMPKACFQASDFMNHRYHRKRALYLVSLDKHIRKSCKSVARTDFSHHHGNRWKPVLVLTPSGKLGKHVTIVVHTSVEDDTFKLSRFHVNKNSIRTGWYNAGAKSDDVSDPPTPYYNAAVLHDLLVSTSNDYIHETLSELTEMKQGIVLLKVWLRQRNLDQVGGLSGHALTLYVVYLLNTKKLTKHMSSYQVFRNTLLNLGSAKFEKGISLASGDGAVKDAPSLDEFLQAYNLVFVDQSGWLNLVATMAPSTYEWLQHECRQAISILEEQKSDSFAALFMTPMPFLHTFDYVFHLSDPACLARCSSRFDIQAARADRHDTVSTTLPKLVELLRLGLGKRVTLLAYQVKGATKWSTTSAPPGLREQRITFGYSVDPDHFSSVLDKGPPADSPDAKEFQSFWGEKSELRRFQDSSICEAVVWKAKTTAERRTVCLQIIQYLLERHAGIPVTDVFQHCDKLDVLLQPAQTPHKPMLYGTGEEQTLSVLRTYDGLSKCLRKLRNLPLSINAVRGTSPVFSYSEVFPSVLLSKSRLHHRQVPLTVKGKVCPYTPCMEVVCAVEGSGKWPEDREAIRRLKAAFYVKLADCLSDVNNMTSSAHPDHVMVVQEGHLFRVVIALTREIAVLKMIHKANGMLKMVETDEAVRLERDVIKLPLIRSSLHAVQHSHNTFTLTCRLLKRWVGSQMLSRHVADLALDLLAAYVYVNPSPYTPPRSAISGFLRVLKLLSVWDWKMNPLVLNFNNAMNKTDLDDLQMTFSRDRTSLPLMYIATPHDTKSVFTRHRPSVPVLHRLVLLADEAVKTLEEQYGGVGKKDDFKQIFRPLLTIYDVVIGLEMSMLPRAYQAVDAPTKNLPHMSQRVADPKLMVTVAFDPVEYYLRELEDIYGDIALFCHDPFGGAAIGVLWKPGAMEEKQFKVTSMNYHQINVDSAADKPSLVPNRQAILDDFAILGRGLVTEVKVKE